MISDMSSNALIDNKISDEEYACALYELIKYREMK